MTEQSIKDKYFNLLAAYVARPEESYLLEAADLGRELVLSDVPPEEIAELHEQALERLAREQPDLTLLEAARLISSPLMELLMAYGLAFRERLEERKRAEEALRESEERYRTVVEYQTDMICRFLPDGTLTFVNQAYCRHHGKQRQELVGHSFMSQILPEERGRVVQHLASFGPETPVATIEYRAVAAGGKVRCQQWINRPLFDEQGNVTEFQAVGRDVTERKQMEEALRRARREWEEIFQAISNPTIIIDPQHGIVAASRAAVAATGMTAQELQGRKCYEIFHGTGCVPPGCPAEKVLLSHNPETTAMEMETLGGIFLVSCTPVFNDEGKLEKMIHIAADITERKRAEEELVQRQLRLSVLNQVGRDLAGTLELERIYRIAYEHVAQLVDCSAFGISLYDPPTRTLRAEFMLDEGELIDAARFPPLVMGLEPTQGRVRAIVTRQPEIITDYPAAIEKATGASVRVGVSKEERDTGAAMYVPMVVRGQVMGLLEVQSYQLNAYSAEHAALLGPVANQIGLAIENARLFEEIEKRRSYLESVLAGAPDAIVTLDAQHNILEWNPGAERLFGYTPQEVVGRNIDDLITGSDANVFEEAAGLTRQIMAGGSVVPTEMVRYRKDGSPVNVIASGSPILIEDKVAGVVVVYTDITEHKQMERQLRHQERLAAVGQLAGGIAHDFNNMLTVIMLYAHQILRQEPPSASTASAAETIIKESKRASKLVGQILDFSRRSPLDIGPMDLKPFIKEAVRILERTIPENIHLHLDVGAEEEYVVKADPTRVQQVLMNLATNARDAMPEGGELRIALSRTAAAEKIRCAGCGRVFEGEWVQITVTDTGSGIPPDVLPRIFEPFFTTKEVGKGTGLGLAQVYGIVEQHGGHIDVETEPGHGTTFRVYLPASGSEEQIAEEEASAIPQGQGEAILLVEDNENLREGGRELLESLGYRVLTGANGREALEVCRTVKEIALVITDIVMPKMGGKQLIHELKEAIPDLKVLALTGYAMEESREELKEAGFRDVVYKPFEVGDLAHVIRRALDED